MARLVRGWYVRRHPWLLAECYGALGAVLGDVHTHNVEGLEAKLAAGSGLGGQTV